LSGGSNGHYWKQYIWVGERPASVIDAPTRSGDFDKLQHLMNMKKHDCPECYGTGEVMIARLYPSGYTECWESCEFCEGEGEFDEDDFLVLRLEGKV